MRSITCDARALFSLGLLLPAVSMAAAEMPHPPPFQDLDMISMVVPADLAAPSLPAADAGAPRTLSAAATRLEVTAGIGPAIAPDQLEQYRGGSGINSSAVSNGLLQDTTAINVMTGKNSISDGAFAHASGLPIVIQNSGANVLIQNSTIVNVEFR